MATRTYGLLAGRRALWTYAPGLVLLAAACVVLWDSSDWRPVEVVVVLAAAVFGLDALNRRVDDTWGPRFTIGSIAVIATAMLVLGPVPAMLLGVASTVTDSLLLRAPVPSLLHNVTAYAWFPLLGGLAAERWLEGLSDGEYVLAALAVAVSVDLFMTCAMAIQQHLAGRIPVHEIVRLYRDHAPWEGIQCLAIVAAAYGYRVGGTGVLAIMLVAVVASEALLLRLDRAERELRGERDLHEKTLRMVGTAVVSIDPELKVTLINSKAIELLELREEDDLIGQDWIVLSASRADATVEQRRYRRLLYDAIGDEQFETTVHLRNGQARILSWQSRVVHDDSGAITGLLLAGDDVTEERDAERRMAYLAYTDALTGLPNRFSFERELPARLAEAAMCGCAAALMFMDLDGFKRINDRHGHAAGDLLLAEAAARLRAVAGMDDVLVRRGGDEFLMVVPDLAVDADDEPGARRATEAVAARLVRAFDAPFPVAGTTANIGITVGGAVYPFDGTDPEALERVADTAMYGQKGRSS